MWKLLSSRRRYFGVRCLSKFLKVSEEVSAALNEGRGVVALESTVITHGMPCPDNVETAKELESVIRRGKCVPATIAIADGAIHVGISDDLMERLATARAVKVSRRDLAIALSRRSTGGTTVSATMIAARMAGISVFATGGIGGVHRGAEETLDISADLTELGRTPVAVICAGVKSILDIPKTLEFLETQGVPVIAYSSDDNWPGFFTATSGCKAPYSSQDEKEIAEFIDTAEHFGFNHGFVVGVPIPETESEIGTTLQAAVQKALEDSRNLSIRGREVTPFILKRLNELTGGLSLRANIALIKNNAMVAARIAKALSEIRLEKLISSRRTTSIKATCRSTPSKTPQTEALEPEVVVVGGTIVDFYMGTNEAVQVSQDLRFYPTNFRGVRTLDNIPTATYAGITSSGNLKYGIGCMRAHDYVTADWVQIYEAQIARSKMVVVDGNIPQETIKYVCDAAYANRVPVWFDPTDTRKAAKICRVNGFPKLSYLSPNFNEFMALLQALNLPLDQPRLRTQTIQDLLAYLLENAKLLFETADRLSAFVITMGPRGVLLLHKTVDSYEILQYAPPVAADEVVNVSGAGDCLNAGIIRGLLSTQNRSITEAMNIGLRCARASLRSAHPVPKELDDIASTLHAIPHISPSLRRSKGRRA